MTRDVKFAEMGQFEAVGAPIISQYVKYYGNYSAICDTAKTV